MEVYEEPNIIPHDEPNEISRVCAIEIEENTRLIIGEYIESLLSNLKEDHFEWNLPYEITHHICYFLIIKDSINLALCDKLLYSQINHNTFWRINFIHNFNAKPNPKFEEQWREFYVDSYNVMMGHKDRLMYVIKQGYHNQIYEVLNSKKFLLTLKFDPIVYLHKTFEYPNNVEMIETLFNNNWDLQEHKDQLLYLAAERGLLDICELLVKKDADLDYKKDNKLSSLVIAALNGKFDVCKFLVESGATIDLSCAGGATALYCATQNGHYETLSYLISKGANIHSPYQQWTPLGITIEKKRPKCCKILLDAGAKVNDVAIAGKTGLYFACEKGSYEIVQLLLEYGADQTIRHNGKTPLYIAAENGFDKVVELLCEDPKVEIDKCYQDRTALYIACQNNRINVANVLLKYKANVNHKMTCGFTPLFTACMNDNPDMVQLLCDYGAEIDNIKDDNGIKLYDTAKDGCKRLLDMYIKIDE
jgi:ankyrin repeat protein